MIRNTSTKQNIAGLDVVESIIGGTPEFGVGGAVAPDKEEAGGDADPCESGEEHGGTATGGTTYSFTLLIERG